MPHRVLVVEDDAPMREGLCTLLEEERYDVACCETVEQARAALAEAPVDMVLLDLILHGESAEPLLAEISSLPHRPMVVVTSAAFELAREVAKRHNVPVVLRPFDLADLVKAIERALATKQ